MDCWLSELLRVFVKGMGFISCIILDVNYLSRLSLLHVQWSATD